MTYSHDRRGAHHDHTSATVQAQHPGRISSSAMLQPVQLKEDGAAPTPVHDGPAVHASARAGVSGAGSTLPYAERIQRAFGSFDVSGVRAHTGGAARQASTAIGAKAYALGTDVAFGGAPDLHTAAHEAAHVVQQRHGVALKDNVGSAGDRYEQHADAVADLVVAGRSAEGKLAELAPSPAITGGAPAVQRKEINPDGDYDRSTNAQATMTAKDWLQSDRLNNTARWQQACLTNLMSGAHGDSSQYQQIDERRDFYQWFYNAACARGYETRWMLAAWVVARGASQVANMDANAIQALTNSAAQLAPNGLQAAMRQGNQMIFDNVMPKLRQLWDGGPLKGAAALQWDMQTLAEEQALVQPMYNALGPNLAALNTIAHQWGFFLDVGVAASQITGQGAASVPAGDYNNGGTVPGLPSDSDITQPINRWRYGMGLGATFAKGGTGYTSQTPMPTVGADYQMNGAGTNAAFNAVNTRQHLHQLEAYLNPAYIGDRRNGGGDATAYLDSIIASLSEGEKQVILQDRMPDGNRYSTEMGMLGAVYIAGAELDAVSDAQAMRCMPTNADPALVSAFIANLQAVRGNHVSAPMPVGVMG